ncbi:MAG: EAL domain-containing protein [Burkholderiales bacterium]|nr:EAL domain-containing protein [Burkholderiales bacterium]
MSAVQGLRERQLTKVGRKVAKLLVVDDELRMRQSLVDLVRLQGYQADTADSGHTAIQRLAESTYDLVLLDLFMPDTDGYAVMQHMVEHHPKVAVIVVSGDGTIQAAIRALRSGAYDFLRKPYEPEELFKTIENALGKRRLELENESFQLKLEQSEKWYRYLVDNSPDIIYTLDQDGCFRFLSNRVETLLGYDKEELIGKHYTTIIYDEDIERAKFVFNERRTGSRASADVEVRLKCKEGGALMHFENRFITIELNAMGMYVESNSETSPKFVGTYGVAKDITDRKKAEETIYHQAYHDLLTGLPNRLLFRDRLNLAIAQAKRSRQKLSVMFLDLDRFKVVNDSLGHVVGDHLLQSVANRLGKCVREGDTLARLGGDEFTLLLPQIVHPEAAANTAKKILNVLARPFFIAGQDHHFSASIGIAIYPEDGDTVDTLIKNADIAMYHVKDLGRNNYAFFTQVKNTAYSDRLSLESDLRKAIVNNELELYYQPQVNTSTGAVVGMEALIRWNHPLRGLLYPADFIPLAEETGLIGSIGEWVLHTACSQSRAWQAAGVPPIRMSVNLSAHQIEQQNFLDKIIQLLRDTGLPSQNLEIEITESAMMKDIEKTQDKLRELAGLGVRISVDDFGTGYSSLSYLKNLPIHSIKIDQSFIRDLSATESETSIVTAMIQIAKGLKLKLIAEGVETDYQLAFLRDNHCEECQGFLFSRPVNTAEATRILVANQPLVPLLELMAVNSPMGL